MKAYQDTFFEVHKMKKPIASRDDLTIAEKGRMYTAKQYEKIVLRLVLCFIDFAQADTLKKKREMAAVIVDCTSRDVQRNKVSVSYKL